MHRGRFSTALETNGLPVEGISSFVPASIFFAPVSRFTGGRGRIVYPAFMIRNIIPLAASLTALFSTLYLYAV